MIQPRHQRLQGAGDGVDRRLGRHEHTAPPVTGMRSPFEVAGDRFELTPAILPAAVGCAATAYRRLQLTQPKGAEAIASAGTGLLLGWTSLARPPGVWPRPRSL